MKENIKNKIKELEIILSNEYPDKIVSVSTSEKNDIIIKFVVMGKGKARLDSGRKAWKNIKKEGRKVKKELKKSFDDVDKQFRNFNPMKDFKLNVNTRI